MKKSATVIFLIIFSLLASVNHLYAQNLSVSSPDKKLTVTFFLENQAAFYRVARADRNVVEKSRLGFRFKDIPHMDGGFVIRDSKRREFNETWTQPWGEKKHVLNHYNELRVSLRETSGLKRTMDLVFRLYNDGLGFRYEFPEQTNLVNAEIIDELTEFNFSEQATAWWTPGREWNRYEYLYHKTDLQDVPLAHTPVTMKTKQGLHISIHEAALIDYSGMSLKRTRYNGFSADLAPLSDGIKAKIKAPFNTPWRTLQITDTAAELLMSDLILNLNEPNKLGDVSWVDIGKYVGIWWEMHLGTATWGSGPKHGATTARTKEYIDFAAKNGFRGVLVEGWNIGWDGDWYNNGGVFNFTKAYADFDIDELSRYAAEKGVSLIGHHETSGGITNYENQLGAALDYARDHGIKLIKTGYVADGGQTIHWQKNGKSDYEWHDSQIMARHYLKVVEEAAKRQISINSHEPIKGTGLRRTYPNWVAREGARGQEFNAWGSPGNSPEHTAILPFTRMLAGPMDFTPGIFDLLFEKEKPDNRIPTTLAKQLSLYVVLYSPIQMAADLPENYEKRPDAFQFIKDVPTDWEYSRALNGEIGDFVTIARKDRHSDDWYLGSLTDEKARTLEVSLNFLKPGISYVAQIYKDGDKGDWQTNPYDLVIEEKLVTAQNILSLNLVPGGGQAMRFTPAKAADISRLK